MRLPHSLVWILLGLSLGLVLLAQEPTQSLREADAAYREGVAALNRNDLDTAQARFETVTRLVPAVEQGHSALGAVLMRKGRWAEGTRELERALAINPSDSAAQLNLAMVYGQTEAYAKAIQLFTKLEAEARTTGHPLAVTVLQAHARCLQAIGQTQAAIVPMKLAVAQEDRNAELHDELGSLYAIDKNWGPAEQQFSDALRLKDDLATAHLHLGLVLSAEQKSGTEEELQKAYRLAPRDPAIALAAGKALADAGHDREALPMLQRAVEVKPKSAAAQYQLALVLQRVDRVREAIEFLKRVVEAEPRNGEALTNLGTALAQAHQAVDGIPFLKRAVGVNPGN
ncbi:MAG: tetratricopeptide repeat protein, partial [Terracidiphilus sp.]